MTHWKVMLLINHISKSSPGIDELVQLSAKVIMSMNLPFFFFYSYQYEGIRKPAYAFIVCSNKILTSSMQRNALKKSYIFFFFFYQWGGGT